MALFPSVHGCVKRGDVCSLQSGKCVDEFRINCDAKCCGGSNPVPAPKPLRVAKGPKPTTGRRQVDRRELVVIHVEDFQIGRQRRQRSG